MAILFANLGWGVMAPISKMVLLSGVMSSLALSGIRISGGALLFLIFSWLLHESMLTRQHVDGKDLLKIFLCSVLMISCNQGMYIIGMGLTNPIDASVMGSMTPMFTMILAAIFLKFPMTWIKVAGVAMGLAGVIILVSDSSQSNIAINPVWGNLLCLGAQFCAAVYYVGFDGIIRKYSPYTLMKWMFFMSVFTYVPFCIPEIMRVDFASLSSEIWLELAYIITIPTFLGYIMIPFAQRSLRPTVLSAYSYLQPVVASVVAVALSVGDFSWGKVFAAFLIFLGIALVNRSSK